MTDQITFTDHDGNSMSLSCKTVSIQYVFDGLSVDRQTGLVGKTTDPIQEYRVVTCTALLSGDNLSTLNGYLMDTAKTYDGTDPKIVVYLDGDTSLTILVAVMSVTATMAPSAGNQWWVDMVFKERSL